MSLTLQLVDLRGHGIKGAYNGIMPDRALFARPEAAPDILKASKRVVWSDLFRSPESSLHAMITKAGVQPPSYSDHNFGGAGDVSIKASIEFGGFKSRQHLDEWLTAECNMPMFWIKPGANNPGTRSIPAGHPKCKAGLETYHHSWFPSPEWYQGKRDTAASAENRVQSWYGFELDMNAIQRETHYYYPYFEAQEALAKLRHYSGKIDGKWGPISISALGIFQRGMQIAKWHAKKSGDGPAYLEGELDPVTYRCLMYCAADRNVVTL